MTDTNQVAGMSNSTLPITQIYEYVFRTSDDGILVADTEGRLLHVNPAAAAMLGETVDDLMGTVPKRTFHKNHALVNLFTREGEQTLDVRLPRRRLAVGLATTLETGERLVMLQDVTEKRDLETRREMLSKTIAHDLRNPMSAISGYADLVGKLGDLNPSQEKYLLRIRQTSTKMYDVFESLVGLAWIEAGMPLAHIPIRLDEAINNAVDEVAPMAKKNRIGIAVSLQTPLPVVSGDPERLHMVIFQLLQNAVIYSNAESNVAIHAWGDEHEIYCSVADQGIGISDDEIELIFDRMYRSRDERVRDIPGGGLGLTLARTIIKRHGGDIWASSNLGEGSTFTFVLPAVQL